jgi:hypothetical protein
VLRKQLTNEEAREILRQATRQVDFLNFARVISSLGEYGFDWNKYDGSKLKPNFNQAWKDRKWLAENAGLVVEALEVLRVSGKK